MRIVTLSFLLYLLPFVTLGWQLAFPTDPQYYTIQIKSFPFEELENAEKLYEKLKKRNYLVYYKYKTVKGKGYYRVRIELFKEVTKAKEFAEKFKKDEGYDYFIDKADIDIQEDYKDRFSIITTPQSIIYRDKDQILELAQGHQTKLSTDSKFIVYVNNSDIYVLDINTKTRRLLKDFKTDSDEAINLQPKWSPDGKYIAYFVKNGWELQSELWVIRGDGSNDECIVPYDSESQKSAQNYLWHPSENKIFYIFGSTYGARTIGSSIFITDLKGVQKIVVQAKDHEDIFREFRILGNTLYYKLAHFDNELMNNEITINTKDITNF